MIAVVSRNYENSIPSATFHYKALTNFRDNEMSTLSSVFHIHFFNENYTLVLFCI